MNNIQRYLVVMGIILVVGAVPVLARPPLEVGPRGSCAIEMRKANGQVWYHNMVQSISRNACKTKWNTAIANQCQGECAGGPYKVTYNNSEIVKQGACPAAPPSPPKFPCTIEMKKTNGQVWYQNVVQLTSRAACETKWNTAIANQCQGECAGGTYKVTYNNSEIVKQGTCPAAPPSPPKFPCAIEMKKTNGQVWYQNVAQLTSRAACETKWNTAIANQCQGECAGGPYKVTYNNSEIVKQGTCPAAPPSAPKYPCAIEIKKANGQVWYQNVAQLESRSACATKWNTAITNQCQGQCAGGSYKVTYNNTDIVKQSACP